MTPKEKFDACVKQAELGASRWDQRRSYEWKMTLGLWAGILASGKFIADKEWHISLPVLIIAGLLLLIAYAHFWLRGLWAANQSDKDWEFHFRREAAKILHGNQNEIGPPPTRTRPSWKFVLIDWSLQFQLLITIFILAVAIAIIAAKGRK